MGKSDTRASSPRVDLLWWSGCPSTPRALGELRTVLSEAGLDPEAINVRQVETDEQAREEGFVGSPTIRVDGRDVEPSSGESPGLTCRLYRLRDGRFSPTPDPGDLRAAVKAAARDGAEGG